ETKKKILELLGTDGLDATIGFSRQLESLMRVGIDGLWLTGFAFLEGGKAVVIEGRTHAHSPGLVARYSRALVDQEGFEGARFEVFQVAERSQVEEGGKALSGPGADLPPGAAGILRFEMKTDRKLVISRRGDKDPIKVALREMERSREAMAKPMETTQQGLREEGSSSEGGADEGKKKSGEGS
ncbi:MAG: hypothetical protein HQL57_09800, partial [Magnetococcales bacterium]|nr:hypothetical protein [Magnetococcales bacterium]